MPDLQHLRNVSISNTDNRFVDDFSYPSRYNNLVVESRTSASGSVGWIYQQWDFSINPTGNWRRLYAGSQLYECDRMNANFKLGFLLYNGIDDLTIDIWKPPDIANEGNIGDCKFGLWVLPPDNWRLLNGDTLQRSEHPEFWEWANNWQRLGDNKLWKELWGIDNFVVKLPDARKDFIRVSNDIHLLGAWQNFAIQGHKHGIADRFQQGGEFTAFERVENGEQKYQDTLGTFLPNSILDSGYGIPLIDNETRSRNMAFNFAIRVAEDQ